MLLLSSHDYALRSKTTHRHRPSDDGLRFEVDQCVEYYSTSRKKWFETKVVRVNANHTVDVTCRANADPSLLRSVSTTPSVALSQDFRVGSRVEYFSDSMNAWVMSYVQGVNADGTYKLNTKKCADRAKIRPLIDSSPVSILTALRNLPRNTKDLCLLKPQLMEALSLVGDFKIEKMSGFSGGQNEGIYFLSGPKKLCLKLVSNTRRFQSIPTECESYEALLKKFPKITSDSLVTFPTHVLTGIPGLDVIVMPVAKGQRMAEVIGHTVSDISKVTKMFHSTGVALARFHRDYMQHGDLQSSNIFVHNLTEITFIDLAGMKNKGCSDIEYFSESIRLLAKTYGSQFETASSAAFLDGYYS